jgi:hypothetical protein
LETFFSFSKACCSRSQQKPVFESKIKLKQACPYRTVPIPLSPAPADINCLSTNMIKLQSAYIVPHLQRQLSFSSHAEKLKRMDVNGGGGAAAAVGNWDWGQGMC